MTADPVSVRVLTVDDHPILREGLVAMLAADARFDVVGAVASAEAAMAVFAQARPDVTLMDLQMPGLGGLAGIRALRMQWPAARVVVLTTYRGDVNARTAMAAGAAGYLLKSSLREELVDCLLRVHAGGRYVCAEVSADIACHVGDETLTPREQRILELIADGLGNKRIADALCISAETVKSHLGSMFEKLGAHSRSEAIRIGVRRGMLMHMDR